MEKKLLIVVVLYFCLYCTGQEIKFRRILLSILFQR